MKRLGIWAFAGLLAGLMAGRFFSAREVDSKLPATSNSSEAITLTPEGESFLTEVESAGVEEFESLYERFTGSRDAGIERTLAQRELILRWIREDPETLIEGLEKRSGYQSIVSLWIKEEGAGFFEKIHGRGSPDLYYHALSALAEADPHSALREFRRLENATAIDVVGELALNSIFVFLAKQDPAAALTITEEFSEKYSIRRADVARWIAEADPQMAVDWAGKLENADERFRSLGTAFAEWVKQDPEAATARFSEMSGEVGGLCRSIVASLSQTDPGAAILWADKHGAPGEKIGLISGSATQIRDPARIAEIHSQLEGQRAKDKFAEMLLINWQDRDMEAGFEWVRQFSTPENSERWLLNLASGVGASRFDEAMRLSEKIKNAEHRETFRHELIVDLAGDFPEKALDLAEKSGNDTLYFDVLDRAVRWNVDSNYWPKTKIAEMFDEFPEDRWSSGVYEFARRWYHEDQEAALKWMDGIEHPKHRREAIQSVMRQLAIADPEAAEKRAGRFTEPADRNEAYSTLAKTRRDSDPAEAFALANQISYRKRRNPILRDIVRTWAMRDPVAARTMVESAPNLSPVERQRLLARIYQ